MKRLTREGLPVVTEETFKKLQRMGHDELSKRFDDISNQNPTISAIAERMRKAAALNQSQTNKQDLGFAQGLLFCYELLRDQTEQDWGTEK